MSNRADAEVLEEVVDELMKDFQKNPFQYGNEQPVISELYHRLRLKLDRPYLPVQFKTDYADKSKWRVRRSEALGPSGKALRVRTEVAFLEGGKRLLWSKKVAGKGAGFKKFDLVVLSKNEKLIMQSKKPGPGDFWDTANSLSVLCEIKHSRNMVSRFYTWKHGAKDILKLSEYPGEVHKRILLFFEWWPFDSKGSERYPELKAKLEKEVASKLKRTVEVVYIPREGELRKETFP